MVILKWASDSPVLSMPRGERDKPLDNWCNDQVLPIPNSDQNFSKGEQTSIFVLPSQAAELSTAHSILTCLSFPDCEVGFSESIGTSKFDQQRRNPGGVSAGRDGSGEFCMCGLRAAASPHWGSWLVLF